MKLGSIWYCMTNACSQPGNTGGYGTRSRPGQRRPINHAAHHVIASSTLVAPAKNISRCGAIARRAGDSPPRGDAGAPRGDDDDSVM